MERIFVDKEARKELNEKYGAVNVSRALYFRRKSLMAKEIRHAAMNTYNGKIVTF